MIQGSETPLEKKTDTLENIWNGIFGDVWNPREAKPNASNLS